MTKEQFFAKAEELKVNFKKLFHRTETEREYGKRLLDRIINASLHMMWCSYLLALLDKTEIAESLSETIATVIIGAVVSYFVSKTFENVNKYGSRLNRTTSDLLPATDIVTDEEVMYEIDVDEEIMIDC